MTRVEAEKMWKEAEIRSVRDDGDLFQVLVVETKRRGQILDSF